MMVEEVKRSSIYAVYEGVEYLAFDDDDLVTLFVLEGDRVPEGFKPSPRNGVAGQRTLPRADLDRLFKRTTTCRWQGEPFYVRAVQGETLYVTYDGDNGAWACKQPGMERTDKFVTEGVLDISQVTDITETIKELPLVV